MIYGVSPFAQKNEIERYCFNDCGKILIGTFESCGGDFLPCNQSVCLFEEKHTEVIGEIQWHPDGKTDEVILRKLKTLNERN